MTTNLDMLPSLIEPVAMRAAETSTDASFPITVRYTKLALLRPRISDVSSRVTQIDLLPGECRRAGITYAGDLLAEFDIMVNGEAVASSSRRIARVPVMVCSKRCNLANKAPADMVKAREEQYELGGFFVINGAEKLLRMIIVPRANAVISVQRDANLKRGPLYTKDSVSMRCMRIDGSTATMHMHFLRTGGGMVRFAIKRAEYFVPVGVLIRALSPSGVTARAIFDRIVGGAREDEALRASALAVVTDLDDWSMKFLPVDGEEPDVHVSMSQKSALAYLGSTFAVVLGLDEVETSAEEAGRVLLRRHVLIHLSTGPFEKEKSEMNAMKVDTLVHMMRKLVACSSGQIEVDDADAPSHQEVLLPGQLYMNFMKEKLESHLLLLAINIRKELVKVGHSTAAKSTETVAQCVARALARADRSKLVGGHMNYFLATGNIKTDTGLDLPQAAGYAIMAERINYIRFITHFRCIHRGAFYATMRSTKVRKLLPEAWGFICPIQTPDGAPCGLLNHLATDVRIPIGGGVQVRHFAELMIELGATPPAGLSAMHPVSLADSLPILCDGAVVGYVSLEKAASFATLLRQLKTQENVATIPATAEVVYVAPNEHLGCGFYPGIFIHTTGCRLMRPVRWLQKQAKRQRGAVVADSGAATGGTGELIGTLEQVFLQVRPANPDAEDTVTPVNFENATHEEISSTAFMSEVAGLTPFPEMNQGPRTIFQCQMAKQTMGTPCHLFDSRFDSKTYRLTSPQIPIVRNFSMQGPMGADLFPNGTNGIVAVLSYTGYDMEDALILNQGSVNRGFCHGTIYANKRLNLDKTAMDRGKQFGPLTLEQADVTDAVDIDGLPDVGARVKRGDRIYATANMGRTAKENAKEPGQMHFTAHTSEEDAVVDQVQVVNGAGYSEQQTSMTKPGVRQATVRTRMSRPPTVGDKFATRAGQKGTVASVWPSEDMPFSESGMMPDILFNPNGFPSRMTIGMMVEQMAGKSGALHGMFHDSTPFRFDEKCRAVDYFGEQLVKAGYNYFGNETLYSGYTGEPFNVDIFMGVIHYQRLRHMVSDKFQVRSTGKVNPLHRQPIQGRKRGGAIRFGEMERDGLLAHGASFLLRDRLGMASDMHVLYVCEKCGSLIAPTMLRKEGSASLVDPSSDERQRQVVCRICDGNDENDVVGPSITPKPKTQRVAIPYSLKYLVTELAAMNIRTRLDLRNSDDVG